MNIFFILRIMHFSYVNSGRFDPCRIHFVTLASEKANSRQYDLRARENYMSTAFALQKSKTVNIINATFKSVGSNYTPL